MLEGEERGGGGPVVHTCAVVAREGPRGGGGGGGGCGRGYEVEGKERKSVKSLGDEGRGGRRIERGKARGGERRRGEERKDEANVSPGVGISGRCATALPGSHLWGQSPPSMGPPRPCPRKATALRHGRGPTTTLASPPPPLHIDSPLPKAILRSIAREKNLTILGGRAGEGRYGRDYTGFDYFAGVEYDKVRD